MNQLNDESHNPYAPPTDPPLITEGPREPLTWYKLIVIVFVFAILLIPSTLIGAFTTCLTESLIRNEALGRHFPRRELTSPEQFAITASFCIGTSLPLIYFWLLIHKIFKS